MVKYSKSDVIDESGYDQAINRTGFILYDKESAETTWNYMKSQAATLANQARFVMRLRSGCHCFCLDKEVIFNYLTRYEGCPDKYFFTKKTRGLSLDIKKVLGKLRDIGKAAEFLDKYIAHRSYLTKTNNFKKVLEGTHETDLRDCNGNVLSKIGFTASVQKNLRFNYQQFDIIAQFPKEACDSIAVEDGYFLAWGDFAQSDFRIAYNLFMRSPENDKIMNAYNDKYEALARIVKKSLGKEFDLEEFKNERQMYKRLTLATVYGMRGSRVPEEQEFITTFAKFLDSCPKYVEYCKRLKGQLMTKSTIELHSYFGHVQPIFYSQNESSTLFDALNSPIQTGTSEIVIRTVMSILGMARENGLTEDQFSLYFTRHDEPIFRIRKDALPFVWILKQHETILVDNWSPLKMEFDFGYNYKCPDDELRKEIEKQFELSKDKIVILEPGTEIDTEYYPIKPLLHLTVHWMSVGGVSIVTYLEKATQRAVFAIYETTDTEELIKQMRIRLRDCEAKIAKNYSGVFLQNNFYEAEDYFGDTHVIYQRIIGQVMTDVVRMCKGMVSMYCRKEGLPIPEECTEALAVFPEQLSELVLSEEVSNG